MSLDEMFIDMQPDEQSRQQAFEFLKKNAQQHNI